MGNIKLDVVKDTRSGRQMVVPHAKAFSTNIANYEIDGTIKPERATGEDNTIVAIPREDTDGYRWARWGCDDRLPTDVRCKIMKSPMASSAVYKLIKMMYGNGLVYYRNSDLREGSTVERARIPAVEQWLTRNRIDTKWLMPQLTDYRFVVNTFSEIILNKRGDFITGLFHKPAEFSRLSKQNRDNLLIEYLYYSTHFGTGKVPPNNEWVKIDLLPWWQTEEFIEKKVKTGVRKFAWHSRLETPGVKYYARAPWLGLFRKNGWVDASIAVPEVVNAMMRNQVVITYQISIPESYFTIRYIEWDSYTDDKRNDIIDELIKDINATLAGTDNLYKSITTVFRQNEMNGAAEGMIEIKPIGDQIKKDSWVPTSDVADAQVVQGFGLHPSQLGLGTKNGGMGAGSGSDQREGYNTEITINTMEQQIVLESLNFCMKFNARTNPDFDVTFAIDHTHHTTTNNQESGLLPSDATIIAE